MEISKGEGVKETARRLQQRGIIRSSTAFVMLARLLGEHHRIQAGEYRFEGPLSPVEVLRKLTRGDVYLHSVTIPEGWTAAQIAAKLAEEGLADPKRFIRLCQDPDFVRSLLGFRAPSLEGFLFPETYLLPKGWAEERILKTMVERFHLIFDERLQERARQMGWTTLQVVTLASLIEKETGRPEERSLISGVFHRRLKLGMRLESDPSVIYGLKDFDGNLRREDLHRNHPYNTYLLAGLPPGPICNPGLESIRAALYPLDQGYLYFVSRNDGSHHFSKTYKEHLRAVALYQKGRRP
jgi:UPF0755 protein